MARNKGINWDEQPLGEMSDCELARRLGTPQTGVWAARTRRGIPPSKKWNKGINWDEQPLGEMSDRDQACRVGVSENVARLARTRRGIPMYTYPCKCCGTPIINGVYCSPCSKYAHNIRIRNPGIPEDLRLLKTKEMMVRNLTLERVATRRKRHGEDKNND